MLKVELESLVVTKQHQIEELHKRIKELESKPLNLSVSRQRIEIDNNDGFSCNLTDQNPFEFKKQAIAFYFDKNISIIPNGANSFMIQVSER